MSKTTGKKKKTSVYTYSGCWTCRKRHIKCDEARPACSRCLKSKLTCAGYDFRFADSDSSRTFRRPVGASEGTKWCQKALPATEVSAILEDLDLATQTSRRGPFSVLSFEPKRQDETPRRLSPSQEAVNEHRTSKRMDTHYQTEPMATEKVLIPPFVAAQGPAPSMVRELNVLAIPPKQAKLFEYFATELCMTLSPMSNSPRNPFRYLYPSLALEGLIASPDKASSRLAVFHGICGTAAWNLRHHDSSYADLSLHHDGLALHYIQQTIERQQAFHDALIPAAIMACLSGDNVAGRIELWGKHAKGGMRCLLGAVVQQKNKDSTTSFLCESFLLMTACGNLGSPQELDILKMGIMGDKYSYVEECHGLTSPVLDAMIAINLLSASEHRHDASRIEEVRLQLVEAAPRFDNPLRHHLANVFYYAALIYYTKALLKSTNTHHLAWTAINHLELATQFGPASSGRILKWPLFTIGAVCDTSELRARLATWCNTQLNIHNVEGFVERLQATWSVSRQTDIAAYTDPSLPMSEIADTYDVQ